VRRLSVRGGAYLVVVPFGLYWWIEHPLETVMGKLERLGSMGWFSCFFPA